MYADDCYLHGLHIVSRRNLSFRLDWQIEAIKSAPRPEHATQIWAFLGMINYDDQFIQNLSTIVQPLNQLLQKDHKFKWTAECERAFCLANELLT